MKIEHLISTMHRKDFSFLNQMRLSEDAVVVNQACPMEQKKIKLQNGIYARVYSNLETGLSRSRNCLLEHASGDICILGDDDVKYLDGYVDVIKSAYNKYSDADIIVFRFTHFEGKETRVRYQKDIRVHLWNISKFASVEVTFRPDAVRNAGIHFNTSIGLGTEFPSGEENTFLADALRAGLKIYHIPKTICIAEEEHPLKEGNEEQYLFEKGASFYCIYKRFFNLYALAFILMKKKTLFKRITIPEAFRAMRKGKRRYLAQQ